MVLPHIEGKYQVRPRLRDDLKAHYTVTASRSLIERGGGCRLKHLVLSGMRAVAGDRPKIMNYIQHRQGEGAAAGTVNREINVLAT